MKFKPFSKKQKKVLGWWYTDGIKDKYDAIIADGSVRSGKTVSMSISFLIWAMSGFSDCNFAICGKTVGSCRRNVIKPLISMLRTRFQIVDKRSENILTVTHKGSSNTFYIFGGKDESSQDLIQGVTLAGILFDEVALMPRSFVEQGLARCSVDGARYWFNCNPDNPNHWFYKEWIQNADEKHALRLRFLMDDNLSLSDRVKQRFYSLYKGTFYRRFILGEWVIAEGLVYQQYNDHISDYLWRGDAEKLRGRWFISIDYGTVNPCSMGLWCVTPREAIRVKESYFNSREEGYQKTDEEHYKDLEQLAADHYIEEVIVDPSAASFKETIWRHNRFQVRNAVNDVINGIRTTSGMLSCGLAKISASCAASQQEFGMYRWDDKSTDDRVIKENDHAMDDIRYFCHTVLSDIYQFESFVRGDGEYE